MYSRFFGFSEKPFDVTPDPKFLYLSQGHREMLATLIYGIRERRGFIAIVGEVGTGKTTLINTVLGRLDEKTKVAYLFNTDVTSDQLLTMALAELGLLRSDESLTKVEAVNRLNNFAIRQLAQGGTVVLIVDEAQNLDRRSMENLRLLSNLETRKHKLIQIVLSGQPELDAKLSQPELRQLAQRISLKRYITPLSEKETYEYIQHRLRRANYNGLSPFNRKAQKLIWEYSRGVPRKINILCDNALLIGFAGGKKRIKEDVTEEAIRDLTWSPFGGATTMLGTAHKKHGSPRINNRTFRPGFALLASLVLATCLIFLLGYHIVGYQSDLRGRRPNPYRHAVRTAIVSKPTNSKSVQSSEQLSAYPQAAAAPEYPLSGVVPATADSETKSIAGQIHNSRQSAGSPVETMREEIPADVEEVSAATLPGPVEKEGVASGVGTTAAPEKEVESENTLGDDQVFIKKHSAEKPVDTTRSENPAVDKTKTPGEKDKAQVVSERIVVVKRGDNLYRIILGAYGRYDNTKLASLLRQNPEINNPDLIVVGQAVKLPAISDNH